MQTADVAVMPVRRARRRVRAVLVAVAALAMLGAAPAAPVAVADEVELANGGAAVVAPGEVTLRKGDRGRAVRRLQRRLRIAVDGVFGPQTRRAVRRFQRRHGLEVDGIVGPLTRAELGLPRFRAAEVRRPRRRRAGRRRGAGRGVKLPRVLRRIARCESGGNPRAVSPNGLYRGKYQFSRETWRAIGGRGGDPARAPEVHQDRMALRLYRREGVSPWPHCGAKAKRR